jgi:ATP-dependent RNA helicase RhlE
MLHEPETVAVTPQATTVERIQQRIIHMERAAKPSVLAELLRSEPIDRALVFTRTKHGADKVVRSLAKVGIAAEAIHGNKSQPQRERVLAAFREGKVRTLIATDIAARGIDVTGISHVFNYDLPNIPESYVHRIGRTARAGADGVAISFCDAEERPYLRDIEKLIRIAIPATDRHGAAVQAPQPAHKQHKGQKSQWRPEHQRPGKKPRRGNAQKQAGRHQPQERDAIVRDAGARQPQAKEGIGGVAFLQRQSDQRPNRNFKSVHRGAR